ncbi:MAG: AAA family ATPase [Candidatus Delongbacteria bacterium]|nr:AAA family ATPase [Candidatus Delongbacteria bacterium]
MKILELRFKNLNSLRGEWIIDLTGVEYRSEGIFVLTGATGSGKSTVLDAVCLALYGATPRLGKITQSGNEIMSRGTGECYAEVLFESQAGRFRCHWEQRRARKKADGTLQDQEHQIIDADTGQPIETKKSLVSGVVEEKTGMDFDRFTRSILLAQGGFDTFLKADSEQKSRILEQITGTGIYSEISRRVHRRCRDEQIKLDLIQAETSGITILELDREREIQQEIDIKRNQESELAEKTAWTAKAVARLNLIEGLKKEIGSLEEESVILKGDYEAFGPNRDMLERAMKAASLDGVYAALAAIRKQQADDQAALKTGQAGIPELQMAAKSQAEALEAAEQQTLKAKEEHTAALPLIHQIRALDQKLAGQAELISEGEEKGRKEAAKIEADQQLRLNEQKKQAEAEKKLQQVEGYLTLHAEDEWLISGLAGIEAQFENLLAGQRGIAQTETMIKKAVAARNQTIKKLSGCTEQAEIGRQQCDEASRKLQQGRQALNEWLDGKLLREYRAEKDALFREMAFIRKIEELESYRKNLEDGKACPLCGSTDHPFAGGNVPVPDETEQRINTLSTLITRAEELEIVVQKLEKSEVDSRTNLIETEKREAAASNDRHNAENALMELTNTMEKLQAEFIELKQAVTAKLQPLGITEIREENLSLWLESFKDRLKAWQQQAGQKAELQTRIMTIESEIKRLDALIETQSAVSVENRQGLDKLKKDYQAGRENRQSLYGDRHPDNEERRLNVAISQAEAAEKRTRSRDLALQQELISVQTLVESLKRRLEMRQPELAAAEAVFLSALDAAGFSDEVRFLAARLNPEQREILSVRARMLDDRRTDLNARLNDRQTCLAQEIAKSMTDQSLDLLESQFKADQESLRAVHDAVTGLDLILSQNNAAKERIKDKQAVIEVQKKECRRWDSLNELIGSADGKKYRTIAQGLTFEVMISHANAQLMKMSDRYLLIREKDSLELSVIDNYQAGEIRSTRNLSGGESFIVSLALALGLSGMAGRNVRVDSLFLDEGFGSLDEEALETALDTLAGLHQEGKLIGIISHVPALKERIGTRISVIPLSGGRSTLAGPGCREL